MSVFTPAEIAYLESQSLGRLATVGVDGQPHVVPLGFRYYPATDTIDTGSFDLITTKRYRDILGNPRAAFIVDDMVSVDPWVIRGVEVRGEVEVMATGGAALGAALGAPYFDEAMLRLRPTRIVSWGIDDDASTTNARSIS